MFGRLAHRLAILFRCERAQATTEYALVVFVTVALLVGISSFVLDGLSAYYRTITRLVCLPIP